jgi:hypothetical protein
MINLFTFIKKALKKKAFSFFTNHKDIGISLINRFKDRIYILFFGQPLGTFIENGRRLFSIIVLNNKLLLELRDESIRCQHFLRMFSFYQFRRADNKHFLYREKLGPNFTGKKRKISCLF